MIEGNEARGLRTLVGEIMRVKMKGIKHIDSINYTRKDAHKIIYDWLDSNPDRKYFTSKDISRLVGIQSAMVGSILRDRRERKGDVEHYNKRGVWRRLVSNG